VDLAFEEAGEWTVVDYKTDRELAAAGEDEYRRQVALYAAAIAQATGRPTHGVLIRV
jgi:ATP-dependent exoDNAse (exonuclease V) beta subunit